MTFWLPVPSHEGDKDPKFKVMSIIIKQYVIIYKTSQLFAIKNLKKTRKSQKCNIITSL